MRFGVKQIPIPMASKHFRMVMMIFLSSLLGLSSCNRLIGFPCEDCRPPDESIAEMATLGVTISTARSPFPLSVNQKYETEHTVTGNVVLYFAPHPDKFSIDEGDPGGFSIYPYEYTYSQEIDGQHVEIPGLDEETWNAFVDRYSNYYGAVSINTFPEELLLGGANVLSTSRIFMAPTRATHVALWHRENQDSERTLVRRVQLSNLYAWRRYFAPLIEGQAQD